MRYNVLGIAWADAMYGPLVPAPRPDRGKTSAISYYSPDGDPPVIGLSYGDFAYVLDYESDNHDWQDTDNGQVFTRLYEGSVTS